MKRVEAIAIATFCIMIFLLISFNNQINAANCIQKMGGYITHTQIHDDVIFKCGKDQSKVCWSQCDGGPKIPGDTINVFIHNPDVPTVGYGYIYATFVSETPGDDEYGPEIRITIEPYTIFYDNYDDWYNNLPE